MPSAVGSHDPSSEPMPIPPLMSPAESEKYRVAIMTIQAAENAEMLANTFVDRRRSRRSGIMASDSDLASPMTSSPSRSPTCPDGDDRGRADRRKEES